MEKFNLAIIADQDFEDVFDKLMIKDGYKSAQLSGKDCAFLSANNTIKNNLEIISKEGLIASEFYAEFNQSKKKPYVVELWNIKEEIKLSDWIKKYADGEDNK